MVYPVCNDIPRDIPERDPPRTHVRTYVRTYVLCENRSPIQSLALMRSAIIYVAQSLFELHLILWQPHMVRTWIPMTQQLHL